MAKKMLLLLAACVLVSGCLMSDSQDSTPTGNLILDYTISDCLDSSGIKSIRSFELGKTTPLITVENNNLKLIHYVSHACCQTGIIETKISENEIEIIEKFTGDVCKCICFSDVDATIRFLESGTYTVNVYFQEMNYEPILLKTEVVTIP